MLVSLKRTRMLSLVGRLRSELFEVKNSRAVMEKRLQISSEKERIASSELAALLELRSSWAAEKESLMSELALKGEEVKKVQLVLEQEKASHGKALDVVVGERDSALLKLRQIEAELEKSQNESVQSLEEGYKICWERAVAAGFNMEEHTFQKYCDGLAEVIAPDGEGVFKSPWRW